MLGDASMSESGRTVVDEMRSHYCDSFRSWRVEMREFGGWVKIVSVEREWGTSWKKSLECSRVGPPAEE